MIEVTHENNEIIINNNGEVYQGYVDDFIFEINVNNKAICINLNDQIIEPQNIYTKFNISGILINSTKIFDEGDYNMQHITKEGKVFEINQLDDSHLLNSMKLFVRKLRESKAIVNSDKKQNKFFLKANNIKVNKQAAYRYIEQFNQKFSHYLYEAFIRGIDLNGLRDELQEILERKTKIEIQFDTNLIGDDNGEY